MEKSLELKLADAVDAGEPEAAAKLLAEGASPEGRNENGWPAAAVAAGMFKAMFDPFLAAGVDPNLADEESGWRLLHAAALRDQRETVEALLASGAEVDAVDASGLTPLAVAAMAGAAKAAGALAAAGARWDAADSTGLRPIDYAESSGSAECAGLLRSLRDVEALSEGIGEAPERRRRVGL